MPLYHVWFATKKGKWLLQGDLEATVMELIEAVAADKGIDLIESEAMIDHVHLLMRAQDRTALSRAMNDIKGVSARKLFEQMPELKLDIGMNNFWQHRYGFKLIPEGARTSVARYIRTQKERPEKYER